VVILTVYITLTFVCLGDEKIGDMPADAILVAHCVPSKDLLKPAMCQRTPIYAFTTYSRPRVYKRSIAVLSLDH